MKLATDIVSNTLRSLQIKPLVALSVTLGLVALAAIATLCGRGSEAEAQPLPTYAAPSGLPSFRLSVQTSTISPSSPDLATVYGSPTSPTAPAASARINALARALENDPDRIYAFVRNSIAFEPQFGLHKGADGVLLDGSGGAFDQAQLMIELLRASGVSARYVLGTVNLGAEASTILRVDTAREVCFLLATAGTPALVNGATSCASLSGVVSTVQMTHVWVEASIGGTWYAFDPALKQSARVAGIDLWAAAGTSATAAWNSISSGVSSGSGDLTGISASGLSGKMTGYATALQAALIEDHSDKSLEQLSGGWDIVPTEAAPRNTTLPGQASVSTRWSGDVPASYRAKLTIATAGFSHVYDLADVYAWRVQAQLQGRTLVVAVRKLEDEDGAHTAYFRGPTGAGAPSCDGAIVVCGYDPGQTAFDAQDRRLDLTIDHPYAAAGGTFADEPVSKSIEIGKRIDILVRTAGGDGGRKGRWAAATDPLQQHRITPAGNDYNNCYAMDDQTPVVDGECDGHNAEDWRYLVQDTLSNVSSSFLLFPRGEIAAAEMATRKDALLNTWTDMFDRTVAVLEPLSGARIFHQHSIGVALSPSYTENTLDIDTSVGIVTDGSDQPHQILSALASLSLAEEGLSIGQSATERPSYPGISIQSTAASRLAIGAGLKVLSTPGATSALSSDVNADTKARIELYLNAGFSVVATTAGTQNAFLARRADGSEQAWILRAQTAGQAPDVDPRTAFRKGAESERPNPTDFLGKAAARQLAANVAGSQLGAVDLRSGFLSFGEGTELSVGQGDFPYSLSFSRSYVSTGPIEGTTGLGMGWTHNWESAVSHASDAGALLPDASGITAAPMLIAALVAIQAGRADTIEASAVSGVALDWLQSVVSGNVVNVSGGGRSAHFVRLADGSWRNPASPTEALARIGGGVIGTYERELIWTQADRSVMTFGDIANPASGPANLGLNGVAKTWIFPTGIQIALAYGGQDQTNRPALTSVSNNLGAALTFTHSRSASYNQNVTCNSQAAMDYPDFQPGFRAAVQACYEAATAGGMLTHVQAGPDEVNFGFSRFCQQYVNFCAFQLTSADRPGLRTRRYGYAAPTGALAEPQSPIAYQRVLTEVADDGVTTPRARFVWRAVGGQVAPYVAEAYDAQDRRTTYYSTTYTLSSAKDAVDAVIRQTYDGDGRLVASFDGEGRVSRATYDGVGRAGTIRSAYGDLTAFAYDPRGNLIQRTQTPAAGCAAGLTTAQQGWWCQTIVLKAEYDTTWDKPSRIVLPATQADPVERDWLLVYNAQGLSETLTGPSVPDGVAHTAARPVWRTSYDGYGRTVGTQDPTGLQTALVWGGGGLPAFCLRQSTASSQTGGLNLTTTMGCNAVGDVTSVTDPRGKTTTATFDTLRRKRTETGPVSTGIATQWNYDLNGDLTEERRWDSTASTWRATTTVFSATHQPLTVTDPSGDVARTCYDAVDRAVAMIDPERRAVLTEYNAAGQPTTIRRWYRAAPGSCTTSPDLPSGQTETRWRRIHYNPGGLPDSETDANGNVTQSLYDGLGRPSRTVYADASEAWTAQDQRGNVVLRRQRSGSFAAVLYDAIGRDYQVREYAAADAALSLRGRVTRAEYDLAGRPVRRSVSTQTTTGATYDAALERDLRTYGYDPAGRAVSETWRPEGGSAGPALTTDYGYDAASNRTSIVWPGGSTATYGFDEANRPVSASFPGNGGTQVVGMSWDSLSRRSGVDRPGSAADSVWTWEPDSDLLGLTHGFTAGSGTPGAAAFAYSHDAAGKTLSIAVTQPVFDWLPATAYGRTYGAANALNQVASEDGVALSFNADANMTSDGVTTYGWTYGNRLESATRSGMSATYVYDSDDRRTKKTVDGVVTRTLWSGADELAEYDAAGTLIRRFIPDGSGAPDARLATVEADGSVFWHHTDAQGSVIATSDNTGHTTGTATYSPYGEFGAGVTAPPAHSPFGYTGRQFDPETGLYQYRARYYSPRLGQFLSTDPVGTKDDPNLTLYVGNDPVNRTDPTGEQARFVRPSQGPPPPVYVNPNGRVFVQRLPPPTLRPGAPGTRQPGEVVAGRRIGGEPTTDFGPTYCCDGRPAPPRAGRGENPQAAYGRQAHQNYRDALGSSYQFEFRLPSGRRPDACNFVLCIVRELKSDTPSATARGQRQVDRDRRELEALTGQTWTSHVDTYRRPVE